MIGFTLLSIILIDEPSIGPVPLISSLLNLNDEKSIKLATLLAILILFMNALPNSIRLILFEFLIVNDSELILFAMISRIFDLLIFKFIELFEILIDDKLTKLVTSFSPYPIVKLPP